MPKKDTAHTKIRRLGCYEQFLNLMRAGADYGEAADFIQGERGELTAMNRDSLKQAIRRFCMDNPSLVLTHDPSVANVIDLTGVPPYIQKLREKVADSLDALTEMETLYRVQLRRVSRMCEEEEKVALRYRGRTDKVAPFLDIIRAELKDAFTMAKQIAELQMDLGVLDKVPARLDARILKAERRQIELGEGILGLLKLEGAELPREVRGLLEDPEKLKEMARRELLEDFVQTENGEEDNENDAIS